MKRCFAILPIAMLALVVSAADQPIPPNQGNRDQNNQNDVTNRDQFNRDQNSQANRDGNTRDPNFAQDNKQPKQAELSYRQRVVTGKVLDTKEADVTAEGKTEKHFLAKIQTLENFPVCVDFGPKENLKTEIKKDDEVAAFGIAGRLNNKPLVFASKVALITPIANREEIFESVPVGFNQGQGNQQGNSGQNSTERLGQQAFQGDRNFDPRMSGDFNGDPRMSGNNPNFQGQPMNFQQQPFRTGSDCENR